MAAPTELRLPGGAEKEDELDLEAIITEFLADDSRTALELPHMTTGQRKQTKKLVEQHPGLRCESFGFGQERQLHLFKASHEASGPAAAAPPAPAASSAAAPSPPSAASPSPKGAGAAAVGGGTPQRAGAEQHWETATTEACSTAASTPGSPSSSPRSSALLRHLNIGKPPGLATPLGVAAVRNTFIHFESSKEDDRQVQSMPHGMFRQQLWVEALSESVAEQALLSPSLSPSVEQEPQPAAAVEQLESLASSTAPEDRLPPGTEVEIRGLSKCPAFNGRRAVVQSYDEETGRYDIVLWSATGEQKAKVKSENLGGVAPLSPVAAPFSPHGSYEYLTSTAAPGGFPWAMQTPTGQYLQAR